MSDQARDGMAWRDVAQSAYRAYAANTGNKNFQGNPMPTWDELPRRIQIAWEAAVRQAGSCLLSPSADLDEQRWAGWLPPGGGLKFSVPFQPFAEWRSADGVRRLIEQNGGAADFVSALVTPMPFDEPPYTHIEIQVLYSTAEFSNRGRIDWYGRLQPWLEEQS